MPHRNIWINMSHGYCGVLDPNIDNINIQPYVFTNMMKSRLEEKWEYIGYDFFFHEFKAQVNVYLKKGFYHHMVEHTKPI